MYSIQELYKIGNGPSSSHTIGPLEATKTFLDKYSNLDEVVVVLYGSLALTGKGHLTDYIIEKTISPIPCCIKWDTTTIMEHPNTMIFYGYQNKKNIATMKVFSIGGGAIEIEGEPKKIEKQIYKESTFNQIKDFCRHHHLSLVQYIDFIEGVEFDSYMKKIYSAMLEAIENGLDKSGILPGKLQVKRKAKYLYDQTLKDKSDIFRKKVMAYAYAVSEENACGGKIVTAPTCGASGVLPACLRYSIETKRYNYDEIIGALKVAGLIGNIVKINGSISGAEAGCQAEVGTACAMSAAFLAYLDTKDIDVVERASEIALEHHLGLTCDPIAGYVQIPCIERNAVAALRAIDAAQLASCLEVNDSKISFDLVVKTMLHTGQDLRQKYKETSEGGLAKLYEE